MIELVTVMVVVAILAAAAVPAMSTIAASRRTVAARQLTRDLTHARERAIASGVRAWITFDVVGDAWTVLTENPANPGFAGAAVLIDPATGRPYTIVLNTGELAGVELLGAAFDGQPRVGFDWLGRPLNSTETPLAGDGAVVLSSNHTITVAQRTGFVSYVPPAGP